MLGRKLKLNRTVVTNSRSHQRQIDFGPGMFGKQKLVYISTLLLRRFGIHVHSLNKTKMHKFACGTHWSFWLNGSFHAIRRMRQTQSEMWTSDSKNVFRRTRNLNLFEAPFLPFSWATALQETNRGSYFVLTHRKLLACTVFSQCKLIDFLLHFFNAQMRQSSWWDCNFARSEIPRPIAKRKKNRFSSRDFVHSFAFEYCIPVHELYDLCFARIVRNHDYNQAL